MACSSDDGGTEESKNYYFSATLDERKIEFHSVNFQSGGNDDRFEQITIGGFETSDIM